MIKSSAQLQNPRGPITPVHYAPPAGFDFDLELFSASELRRRAAANSSFGGIERIEFHFVIYVISGTYRHALDFETYECKVGNLLIAQPGQVHRFGPLPGWDGWTLMFRPELLQPTQTTYATIELDLFQQVQTIPQLIEIDGEVQLAVAEAFERMTCDMNISAAKHTVNALLRNQLHTLMIRLHLAGRKNDFTENFAQGVLQRFRRYKSAVEREFFNWHHVAQYANHLGCSEKSLYRATMETAGVSAKTFLTNRIILEAKRLLAHTTLPVAIIGDRLGFDEATNFAKVFRRESGMTPGEFRKREG